MVDVQIFNTFEILIFCFLFITDNLIWSLSSIHIFFSSLFAYVVLNLQLGGINSLKSFVHCIYISSAI